MSGVSGTVHVSVMPREVVELLGAAEGGDFLDCTLGGGGHTQAILEANPANRVTALDRDTRAVERVRGRLADFSARLTVTHAPFSRAGELFAAESFDGVLADLGLSTDQLREGRGFSFADTGPLDMRMDESVGGSAAELVNTLPERELFVILKRGGAGSEARAVARAIVRARPIATPAQLAEVVAAAARPFVGHDKHIHPATVVFQAIRMAVNDELGEIERLLGAMPRLVRRNGRAAVITFHSLEDRLVTQTMRRWQGGGEFSALMPGRDLPAASLGELVTRKPILPSAGEISQNPSARSARLRVFRFSGR